VPRATILLVDDNESFLSGLTELLRNHGFTVVPRGDFVGAREYLQQHVPDVLVTDVRLREYNGLHLVWIARARSVSVLAIVYSSHFDPVIEAEANGCGALFLDKRQVASELIARLAGDTELLNSDGPLLSAARVRT
jgi:DNA-binding NtrC family response regulator